MQYTGKLYAKIANKYLEISHTNDFENLEKQTTSLKAEVESLQSQLAKAEADKQELLNLVSRLDDYFFCEKQLEEYEYEELLTATHESYGKYGED